MSAAEDTDGKTVTYALTDIYTLSSGLTRAKVSKVPPKDSAISTKQEHRERPVVNVDGSQLASTCFTTQKGQVTGPDSR